VCASFTRSSWLVIFLEVRKKRKEERLFKTVYISFIFFRFIDCF
jgi:hypothetical protein